MANMQQYECDGCGKTTMIDEDLPGMDSGGTIKDEINKYPSCGCKEFMGWMLVGGRAWHDYHDNGIRPMDNILSEIKELVANHPGCLETRN